MTRVAATTDRDPIMTRLEGLERFMRAAETAAGMQLGGIAVRVVTGIPTGGNPGDYALRKDGGGAGATHLYFNNGGTWIGIA